MKKILACFALPVVAAAAIASFALGSYHATRLIEGPGGPPLALLVFFGAVAITAAGAESCHRLILFIESHDSPRRNQRVRRYTLPSDL